MPVRPDERWVLHLTFRIAATRRHDDVRKSREGNRYQKLQILGVRPAKRGCRAVRLSKLKAAARNVRSVPQLLREGESLTRKSFERPHELGGRKSHGEEMTRPLTRQHRPGPPVSAAVPRRTVLMLAVAVPGIAPPARACGEADLQRAVDALEAAQNALVLWPAKAVADEL